MTGIGELIMTGVITLVVGAIGFAVAWGRLTEKQEATDERNNATDLHLKEISLKLDSVHLSSERMSVALWGIDQSNGLRGEVREMKQMIDELADKIDELIQR